MRVVLPKVHKTLPPGVPKVPELLPFGPIHWDCPQLELEVNIKVSPLQSGALLVMVGLGGGALTVTVTVVSGLWQPLLSMTNKV